MNTSVKIPVFGRIPSRFQTRLHTDEICLILNGSSGILWRHFGCFTHTNILPVVALSKQDISITGSWCLSLSALWPLLLWPHVMVCLRRSLRLKIQSHWGSKPEQSHHTPSHSGLKRCWFALTFYFHWHVL